MSNLLIKNINRAEDEVRESERDGIYAIIPQDQNYTVRLHILSIKIYKFFSPQCLPNTRVLKFLRIPFTDWKKKKGRCRRGALKLYI